MLPKFRDVFTQASPMGAVKKVIQNKDVKKMIFNAAMSHPEGRLDLRQIIQRASASSTAVPRVPPLSATFIDEYKRFNSESEGSQNATLKIVIMDHSSGKPVSIQIMEQSCLNIGGGIKTKLHSEEMVCNAAWGKIIANSSNPEKLQLIRIELFTKFTCCKNCATVISKFKALVLDYCKLRTSYEAVCLLRCSRLWVPPKNTMEEAQTLANLSEKILAEAKWLVQGAGAGVAATPAIQAGPAAGTPAAAAAAASSPTPVANLIQGAGYAPHRTVTASPHRTSGPYSLRAGPVALSSSSAVKGPAPQLRSVPPTGYAESTPAVSSVTSGALQRQFAPRGVVPASQPMRRQPAKPQSVISHVNRGGAVPVSGSASVALGSPHRPFPPHQQPQLSRAQAPGDRIVVRTPVVQNRSRNQR